MVVRSMPRAVARTPRGFAPVRAVGLIAAALALAGVAAACGGSNTTPPDVSPDPQTVTAIDGRFEVRFTVDRTTLRPGDSITGTAELWLKAGGSGTIWGPSDLFGFEFVEVGGENRVVTPVFDLVCAPHQVGSDRPLTMPITKSGAVTDTDPHAAFVREFLQGREIHLPAGGWDITAATSFFEGRGCAGLPHSTRATVRVVVKG